MRSFSHALFGQNVKLATVLMISFARVVEIAPGLELVTVRPILVFSLWTPHSKSFAQTLDTWFGFKAVALQIFLK